MNLNPFSHNYLNQLPTANIVKVNIQTRQTPFTKPNNKQTKTAPTTNQQYLRDRSSNFMEAQFQLQPRYLKCNLQYTNEGYLIASLRKDNKISGRSYILFPEGIIANCNVMNSKLSGWIAICKKDQFYNISHFSGGKLNGLQYIYDLRCSLTLQSLYNCGKLQSVKRGVADSQLSFQKCLKNKQLIELLHSTLDYTFLQKYLPKISSSLGNYYGQKIRKMPNGLGILITESQWFYGNFKRGLLSQEGVMIFSNGNSYIGQFRQGMTKGYGNFISNGNYQYKYNDTFVSQAHFNYQRNISSIYEHQQLASIFHPIVNLYQKLKVIYQNRRKDPQQKIDSFVNVQIDNNPNQDQEQQQYKQSEQSTPRENIFSQLINTNNNTTNSKQSDTKNKKKNTSFAFGLTPISQIPKQQKNQDTKQKTKQQDQFGKKKNYKTILVMMNGSKSSNSQENKMQVNKMAFQNQREKITNNNLLKQQKRAALTLGWEFTISWGLLTAEGMQWINFKTSLLEKQSIRSEQNDIK